MSATFHSPLGSDHFPVGAAPHGLILRDSTRVMGHLCWTRPPLGPSCNIWRKDRNQEPQKPGGRPGQRQGERLYLTGVLVGSWHLHWLEGAGSR